LVLENVMQNYRKVLHSYVKVLNTRHLTAWNFKDAFELVKEGSNHVS
jgi:hypothetical protein